MKKIILASKSPRRKELLKLLDVKFSVEIREVDELYSEDLNKKDVAEYLANLKADSFIEVGKDQLIITADTIVLVEGKILGKPKNKNEAFQMLSSLSNKSHDVITGVCIKTSNKSTSFSTSTKVFFKALSSAEIEYYIDTYKPFDKAGSYGIQEWIGAVGISKIEGSYYNVVGLPIHELNKELKSFL
tara:strand:+ start:203 stop:763 length:561 start_codon:yes stop_codon:yes gene_type:complete